MKILFQTLAASPHGIYHPGIVYDLPEGLALAFLRSRTATPVIDQSVETRDLQKPVGEGGATNALDLGPKPDGPDSPAIIPASEGIQPDPVPPNQEAHPSDAGSKSTAKTPKRKRRS